MKHYRKESLEIDLDDVVPFADNPRVNDDAVEFVANSIEDFDFINPIVIDEDNVILAGHTRVKAAKARGMRSVPAIRVYGMPEADKMAFRIADNKTQEKSGWDFDRLDAQIDRLLKENVDMSKYGVSLEYLKDEPIPPDEIPADAAGLPPADFGDAPPLGEGDVVVTGRSRVLCASAPSPLDPSALGKGVLAVASPDEAAEALRGAGVVGVLRADGRFEEVEL